MCRLSTFADFGIPAQAVLPLATAAAYRAHSRWKREVSVRLRTGEPCTPGGGECRLP